MSHNSLNKLASPSVGRGGVGWRQDDSSPTPVPCAGQSGGGHPRAEETWRVQAGGEPQATALHTCHATRAPGDPGSMCLKNGLVYFTPAIKPEGFQT